MFQRSLILTSFLACALGFVGVATGHAGTVQGFVKGSDGKAIDGAEVHLSRNGSNVALQKSTTDKSGQYAFKNLSSNATYRITAWVNKVPTAVENVKPRDESAIRVDFDISNKKVAKKAKHWVWFPSETGSHLGGRWVEVDENGMTATGTHPVDTMSGKGLEQAFRSRPAANPSGGH